jgi:hypothetical protein
LLACVSPTLNQHAAGDDLPQRRPLFKFKEIEMSPFEACAIDIATSTLQIVKDTVGISNPDQFAAIHDIIVQGCGKMKGLAMGDVDVDAVIRNAIHAVFDTKS